MILMFYISSLNPHNDLMMHRLGNGNSKSLRNFPKVPKLLRLVDEWTKHLWDIFTMEYYPAVKTEENFTLCNSMNGPGEHYAK